MEAIEFVSHYPDYIRQLEAVVKPEYRNTIKKLKELDPRSIVKPEHYFNSELEALGAGTSYSCGNSRRARQKPLNKKSNSASNRRLKQP
jgi:hypothetical protein